MVFIWYTLFRNDPEMENKTLQNLGKQLREFTNTTQRQLEDERTELLTRNAMLEEDVKNLQALVDTSMNR